MITHSPPVRLCLRGEPAGEREQLGQLGRGVRDGGARGLRERPAGPRLVQLPERAFEVLEPWEVEADDTRGGRRRAVKLGEHRDHSAPVLVALEAAELPHLA